MHPAAWSLCDSWATCNLMQNLCSLKLNFKHFWDNKCCGYYKLSNFYSDRDISSFCGNVCAQRMWVNNAVWRGVLQVAISRFEPDHYLPYRQLQRNLETVRRRYSQCLCVCVCVCDCTVRPKPDCLSPRTPNSLDQVVPDRFRIQCQAGLASSGL